MVFFTTLSITVLSATMLSVVMLNGMLFYCYAECHCARSRGTALSDIKRRITHQISYYPTPSDLKVHLSFNLSAFSMSVHLSM